MCAFRFLIIFLRCQYLKRTSNYILFYSGAWFGINHTVILVPFDATKREQKSRFEFFVLRQISYFISCVFDVFAAEVEQLISGQINASYQALSLRINEST